MKNHIIGIIIFLFLFSCKQQGKEDISLYQVVTSDYSGISFGNYLALNESVNYFTFGYVYSGAGVAIGDINNDGLQDIYFTGNTEDNRLYLNLGDLKFQDITMQAGVSGDSRWDTGVTMADVNADGFLDIYVSVSGLIEADRRNMLFINNKDLTFTESAAIRKLDDNGHSTQASFFDYDRDGDLDVYVANYPPAGFTNPPQFYRNRMDSVIHEESDHLYENDGKGFFKDVTPNAGLLSYGQSLGITVCDINNDGWSDLYVSNDFSTPDYLYLNNTEGTFREVVKESTQHTSFYGMGVDVADFNNDGLMDIIQADMNPADNLRSKANMSNMDPALFWESVNLGFHYQYMKNSLQVNQGLRQGQQPFFSEVSQLNGISSTDWSWASLFIDMDNDGWKDIFISNGIRRDINNKDFFKRLKKRKFLAQYNSWLEVSDDIPSKKIANCAFLNNKGISFSPYSVESGLNFEGYSNGSAYGDLDNDGDLDLIVNNVDTTAMVFENKSNVVTKNTYLRFKFSGPKSNTFGLGTKVKLINKDQSQYQELTLTRGYQSSVEPIIHFGTRFEKVIEKVIITWPSGHQQILLDVATNQLLEVEFKDDLSLVPLDASIEEPIFLEVLNKTEIHYKHVENEYNDFEKESLLPHKLSQIGPGLAVGDINADGLDDFYIGGAAGSKGELYIQGVNGSFVNQIDGEWRRDKAYEDTGALLFDADGDMDLDLYVVSGGNEFEQSSLLLQDRLYENRGDGTFRKSETALPQMLTSGLNVNSIDFDQDGDLDLFVGGRITPQSYPLSPRSYLLENISVLNKIQFKDITNEKAPDLMSPGMVTSSVSTDFDLDGDQDLILVGEWMPISFFQNEEDGFVNVTEELGFANTTGWWYSIIAEDFDNDGDEDMIVGNLGLNYKYKATEKETFDIYASDYDNNSNLDIVLGYYNEGIQYPVRGRQCSAGQIPSLEYKFRDYTAFAEASLTDIYTEEALESSVHYQAKTFASSTIENIEGKNFLIKKLPNQAQFSCINDIAVKDFNSDGNLDIIVVGNLFVSEVETPRNDASYGLLLTGNGNMTFNPISYEKSGFYNSGDARAIAPIKTSTDDMVLVANNNDSLKFHIARK